MYANTNFISNHFLMVIGNCFTCIVYLKKNKTLFAKKLVNKSISGRHSFALPRSCVTRRHRLASRRHANSVSSRGAASHHHQGWSRHQLRARPLAVLHLPHVQVKVQISGADVISDQCDQIGRFIGLWASF